MKSTSWWKNQPSEYFFDKIFRKTGWYDFLPPGYFFDRQVHLHDRRLIRSGYGLI